MFNKLKFYNFSLLFNIINFFVYMRTHEIHELHDKLQAATRYAVMQFLQIKQIKFLIYNCTVLLFSELFERKSDSAWRKNASFWLNMICIATNLGWVFAVFFCSFGLRLCSMNKLFEKGWKNGNLWNFSFIQSRLFMSHFELLAWNLFEFS